VTPLSKPVLWKTPIILVHGVFGSRLRDRRTGKEVWPGGITLLLFNSYDDLALPIDAKTLQPAPSNLEAYAITDRAAGRDFYGAVIRTLETSGGYLEGNPGERVTDGRRRYYILVYDWRQDNVETARRLDELINRIRRDYADPDLKVDIVAHSMGGLATRYSYFPMDHSILLCESHDSLTGNVSFQNNLLNILLTRDQPLAPKSMQP